MTGAIGTSDCTVNSPNVYHIGCMDAFVNFAKKHAAKIAGVGIGLGIIQVFSSLTTLDFSNVASYSVSRCSQKCSGKNILLIQEWNN